VRISGMVFFCLTTALCGEVHALDCLDLKPVSPQNSDTSLNGKIEAGVGGMFKKLLNPQAAADAAYHKVITDVQPEFPNADKIYVWERILFLQCQVLNEDKAIATNEKLEQFREILKLYDQPPPTLAPGGVANTITNSGSNAIGIQGSNNSISISGGKP
jgi:hypothetical protein